MSISSVIEQCSSFIVGDENYSQVSVNSENLEPALTQMVQGQKRYRAIFDNVPAQGPRNITGFRVLIFLSGIALAYAGILFNQEGTCSYTDDPSFVFGNPCQDRLFAVSVLLIGVGLVVSFFALRAMIRRQV